MINNPDRVEQYLVEIGFVEQAMAKHIWLKQYELVDCSVDLNGSTIDLIWYPHGNYTQKSNVLKDQPELKELKKILLNISKSNHLPSILNSDIPEPDNQATEPSEEPDIAIPEGQEDSADNTAQPGKKDPVVPLEDIPSLDSKPSSDVVAGSTAPVSKATGVIPTASFAAGTTKPVNKPDAPDAKQDTKEVPKPAPALEPKPEPKPEPKSKPKSESATGNLPAVVGLTDAELDRQINDAKAEKWLTERGDSYKVHGKERPDAAGIQRVSNMKGVSIEILRAVQTSEYAEAIVRAHLDGIYVDAAVHHSFDNYRRILILEMINKNPQVLDCWNGEMPVIKEGSKIKDQSGVEKDAKYSIMHTYFAFVQFALRDAVTKATAAAQAKVLNREFRDPVEIQAEQREIDLVNKK